MVCTSADNFVGRRVNRFANVNATPIREAVMRRGVRADEAAQGSGLGLAIVRDLAEIHGGSISLEEPPMGGARARLTLPAQEVV
ncbi:MAG TPA: ATP-binding protein [Blastocatellia bacterium]|jgi:Signal transduction histidine kinase